MYKQVLTIIETIGPKQKIIKITIKIIDKILKLKPL